MTPDSFRVSKDGVPVRLEPKAFEVLVYLAERAGEVVTRQELLDNVWKGTFVTENALSRAVAQIRKALGDDLQTPRYIETVPTRGYRLIAPLEHGTDDVVSAPAKRSSRRSLLLAVAAALVLALALSIFLIRRPQVAVTPLQETLGAHQLTRYPGLDLFPSFSPDGSAVAYSSDHSGSVHIYISQLQGGREIQVTSGNDGEIQPAWSPDGRTLAFVSATRGGIWLVPALGGSPVQLTGFGSRPEWSPDGRSIAFQSGVQIEFSATVFESFPPSALWVVDLASGRNRQLTRPGTPVGGHGAPHWRGDGRRIAFVTSNLQTGTIYTIGSDGSALKEIVRRVGDVGTPVYGPDGHSIYYIETQFGGDSRLCRLRLKDDETTVGEPAVLRRSSPGRMHYLALSRDGRRMVWSVIEQSSNLISQSVGPDGLPAGEPKSLTNNTNVRNTVPSFSPDGRQLAYCSIPAGQESNVWLASADGKEARAITSDAGSKYFPHWSPDGTEVVYSVAGGRSFSVNAVSLATGRSRHLLDLPDVTTNTSLSPDGRSITFDHRTGEESVVWTAGLDGTTPRRVTSDSQRAGFPVWSPQGDRLAVAVLFPGGSALGTMPAGGGAIRVLTPAEGECWPNSWSPDGNQIAFARRYHGVWNIWSAAASGREPPRQLTSYASPATIVRFPAWSPDGGRIVFELGVPRGNIWISDTVRRE